MDYGVKQSQEGFPEAARKTRGIAQAEKAAYAEPEQSRSCRLESHRKGRQRGEGRVPGQGLACHSRETGWHTRLPPRKDEGGPGRPEAGANPERDPDGLGWPSGGGGSPGARGLSTGVVRSRWKEAEGGIHCRTETHMDRREEARAALRLLCKAAPSAAPLPSGAEQRVCRAQTAEPVQLKLPLPRGARLCTPPRAPRAPDVAPEVAAASQADPDLQPLCSARSTEGPGPGKMSQQRGEVTACGRLRGREGLSTREPEPSRYAGGT